MDDRDRLLAEGPRVAPEPQTATPTSVTAPATRSADPPAWKSLYEAWLPQILSFGPAILQIVFWSSAPEWVTWTLVLLGFVHATVVTRRARRRRAT
jgi:hypothetical protein